MSKFLILSSPRSASTLLCYALNSHAKLNVQREIFLLIETSTVAWRKEHGLTLHMEDLTLLDVGLKEFIDGAYNVVDGFKILYGQIPTDFSVWDHIKSNDAKIIYLERDLLDCAISCQLAMQTNIWQRSKSLPEFEDNPIRIDPDWMYEFLNIQNNQCNELKEIFAEQESIVVSYEDLIGDWAGETSRILSFLEVESQELKKVFSKRTTTPLESLVTNYDEIKGIYDEFHKNQA